MRWKKGHAKVEEEEEKKTLEVIFVEWIPQETVSVCTVGAPPRRSLYNEHNYVGSQERETRTAALAK